MAQPILPPQASTTWQETPGSGEAATAERLSRAIERYQQGFADCGDGRPRRAFHVKSHAGLRATFTVSSEVPPRARFGVFAVARSFEAWVRTSNGFSASRTDWLPDLLGFSVRLLGVEGARLADDTATIQDFIALNQTALPAENGEQLFVISTASTRLLSAPFKIVAGLGLGRALRVAWWGLGLAWRRLWTNSVVTETYFSNVPITIGPHAVKFAWQPRSAKVAGPLALFLGRNYLRRDLARRLGAGDVLFDFLVQFYVDAVKTPIDGAAEWSGNDAPYVKFAELTIHRTELGAAAEHAAERYLDGAALDPWNGLAAHRPIGNIQRTRRAVYLASSRFRGSWQRDGSEGLQELD